MFLGRVIGTVWSTRKDPQLTGCTLQFVQPVDRRRNDAGDPVVAVDTVGAGVGETVIVVTKKEAVIPLTAGEAPVDASIVGIVDRVDIPE
ncbi:MAG TPA: EutN/CcmL family microcompartment protein [Bacteroidota bacterium]|nr:EutN/CcmL family microcompartment protein [Bacteroidota bacterium]